MARGHTTPMLSLNFLVLVMAVCCASTQHSSNHIVEENRLEGERPEVWDINGAGDPTIQVERVQASGAELICVGFTLSLCCLYAC